MESQSLCSDTIIVYGRRFREDTPSPLVRHPGAELWTVTNTVRRDWGGNLPGWTQVYNLHPNDAIAPATREWYQQQTPERPIWMLQRQPDIPASVTFPIAELRAQFPDCPFGCMDDFVIANAIVHRPRRIVLDGVGTSDDPLFQYLHRTVWHWIGLARGRGIELVVEQPSCFATTELYGYDRLGHGEMHAFNEAWKRTAPADEILGPLTTLMQRLSMTGTLNHMYAQNVIETARSYFRTFPQHDDNGD